MPAEIPENDGATLRGWVFYDGECPLCVRGVRRAGGLFTRRGFVWQPLQTAGAARRLGLPEAELQREMKLLRANGGVAGGVDAWIVLLRSVWWLWPLGVLLTAPGIHSLAAGCYRVLARHRHCVGGRCALHRTRSQPHRHSAFLELP